MKIVDDWIWLVGCRWEMILDNYSIGIYSREKVESCEHEPSE